MRLGAAAQLQRPLQSQCSAQRGPDGVGKHLSGAVLPRQCKPPTLPTTTQAGFLRVWEKPATPSPRPAFWMENLMNCWPFRKTQGPAERSS